MRKTVLRLTILLLVVQLSVIVLAAETTLVSTDSTWKYLDDGSKQVAAWQGISFNDSLWYFGPAQLGCGTEIYSTNMPAGTITYTTMSPVAVAGGDESVFHETSLGTSALLDGTNVLAIEIHQNAVDGSDISMDAELIGSNAATEYVRKGPYLIYPGSNTQMTVLFQFTQTMPATLDWGLDTNYTLGTHSSTEYGSDHQHQYTITNLTPGSVYYYRLTVNTNEYIGSFRAGPGDSNQVTRFFAYGDTRTYPASQDDVCAAVLDVIDVDPNWQTVIFHVGDWVDNGGTEIAWDTEFFDSTYTNIMNMQRIMPIQGCIGNHEFNDGSELFSKYYPYPFVDDHYWSFDYGQAHFAILDQYVDYDTGSDQLIWLANDMANTTKPWKFLVFHEPGYSAGGHANNVSVQNDIQSLCETYGVQIIFAGHNHYYARAEHNDAVHITTGGGGAPLYAPDPEASYVVRALETYQFCKIEILGNQLFFEALNADGSVIDSFELTTCDVSILPADLTGPNSLPDCEVDLFDFAEFVKAIL